MPSRLTVGRNPLEVVIGVRIPARQLNMEKPQNLETKETFKVTPVVYVILERDKKILFLKRKASGNYSLPAGHLEMGEQLSEAAIREAREEIGVNLNAVDMNLVHLTHFLDRDGQRVGFFFKAGSWSGEPSLKEEDKHEEIDWFSLDNLPRNTVTSVKHALEDIQSGKIYSEFGW